MIWGLWILPSELGQSFIIFPKGQVQLLTYTFTHSFHKYMFSTLDELGSILGAEHTAVNKTNHALALTLLRKLAFECEHSQ